MVGMTLLGIAVAMLFARFVGYKYGYEEGKKAGYQSGWLRGIEAERRAHQEDEDNKPNEHLTYAGTEDNP